jgi:hypothetical protein
MRHVYFTLCLLTLGAAQLHGQQLSIGQIPYRLGMTIQEAIAMTHDPIYLDDRGEQDTTAMWVVREKHAEHDYVLIGTIFFRNGKAESLRRDLKSFSGTNSKDLGNTLFQALEHLKHDDPNVSIQTKDEFISSESGGLKTITIGNGRRRVEITIPTKPNIDVTITEVLTLAE